MSISLIIADDHDIIREGIKSILKEHNYYTIVGEAKNGQEALDLVEELKPNILLLDITMPVLGGLEIVERIKRVSKNTKIIILTVHKMGAYVTKALHAGVQGYLNKENATEELLPALRQVERGKMYLSEDISSYLAEQVTVQKEEELRTEEFLSQRELDIIRLVAEGKTANEVGKTLCLSRRTVENYKNSILKKLNLHKSSELIKYALEHGLIDTHE